MTTMKGLALVAMLFQVVLSVNEAGEFKFASEAQIEQMESVFARSEAVHMASVESLSQKMTVSTAAEFVKKHNANKSALIQVAELAVSGATSTQLRKQPKGYSGLDGAKALLNDMIFESMTKYDAEIARCTEYYATCCSQMEVCRGSIAASNYVAANSRSLILDAQANIAKCEEDIPETKLELKQHNLKCKHELHKMNERLKIVQGDIAVMTTILEMTDCEKKLLQMEALQMMHCQDKCNKKNYITFGHDQLKQKVSQLQSTVSKTLLHDSLRDLFDGIESMESAEFMQVEPVKNKTDFNTPPTPKTEVPSSPCDDPDAGAPSAADKRAAKCTLSKSPQCYKLQERFLLIQAGIQDEADQLNTEISKLETTCEEIKGQLETSISNDQDMLANQQTKLAAATEKEATAAESARQTAARHKELEEDLQKTMKTCSDNYIAFESEQAALKKIRGELYKMKGGKGGSGFFQDCELSKWDPEECTKSCAGGEMHLSRSVLTHPNGGAKCLPLEAMKSCNLQPCPVDCSLEAWSGWSKCSADCGGGVQQRLREVKQAMKFNGNPCGETSESKACNGQACEADCELSDWTKWGPCSKDCDGGTRKRQKFISEAAQGEGTCPDEWSLKRLEYRACAMRRCVTPNVELPLMCNKSLDIILLIDGSGSLGKKGWEAEIAAVKLFLEAFKHTHTKAEVSIILYSGPKTWSGVAKCTGKSKDPVNMEDVCKIKTVSHFTNDIKKLDQLVTGLEWPEGSTLTSLALATAKAELALGRQDSHGIVVVFTDGRPLSIRKTELASKLLRKTARLVWVPITKFAPLAKIKEWATRRWEENVIPVPDFESLQTHGAEYMTHIIADICPENNPEALEFPRDGGALN